MIRTQNDALSLQTAEKHNCVQPHLPRQSLSEDFWSALPTRSKGRGLFWETSVNNLPSVHLMQKTVVLSSSPTYERKEVAERKLLLLVLPTDPQCWVAGPSSDEA